MAKFLLPDGLPVSSSLCAVQMDGSLHINKRSLEESTYIRRYCEWYNVDNTALLVDVFHQRFDRRG